MSKSYICISESFDVGGKESCIIRMFEWVKKQDFVPILFLKQGTRIDNKWHKKIKELDIKIFYVNYCRLHYCYDYREKSKIQFKSVIGSEECYILSTSIQSWIFINSLINKVKLKNCYHKFYVVHPHSTRGVIHSEVLSLPYKIYLIPKLENEFIFMDEETKDNFINFNSWEKNKTFLEIIPLPLEIPDLNKRIIEKRINSKDFNILTITRMVFPFKGYVLGLIDDFEKMCKEKDNITLTIVGDGKDFSIVEMKIQQLDERIKRKIRLLGNVSYEELREVFLEATVYVGMGTTLIDAASTGLISIGATAEQYKNYSYGFFSKECNKVGVLYGEEDYNKYCFIEMLNQVYSYSTEKYIDKSEKIYDLAKSTYDINYIMPRLLFVMKRKTEIIISPLFWCYDKFIVKIKDLYNYFNKKKSPLT